MGVNAVELKRCPGQNKILPVLNAINEKNDDYVNKKVNCVLADDDDEDLIEANCVDDLSLDLRESAEGAIKNKCGPVVTNVNTRKVGRFSGFSEGSIQNITTYFKKNLLKNYHKLHTKNPQLIFSIFV